ncbi:MAG TPA: hypothetical protein VFP72_18195 [Kineosporiaceae bacterium]|nr:hypothetical protein [Kineosporiaceae bacterium]
MRIPIRHRSAALAAGGAALIAVLATAATPALAATAPAAVTGTPAVSGTPAPGTGPAAVQKQAAAEIAARQTAITARLNQLSTGGNLSTGDKGLTAADRQALITILTGDRSGLGTLGAKIAADTDLATARADRQKIFTGYRVFALAMPQVRLVRAADALTTEALPRLADAQARLQAALEKAGRSDQAAAQLADLGKQLDTLRSATSGLSAKLLAFTPAQYDADHDLLAPSRQSLLSAREALRQARADLVALRALLHS